jgi:endonuclease-3
MGDADSGTYSLLVEVPESTSATVGAVGTVHFDAGWYAYTGSALGPGGFARVDRHRELARGDREARHWHIDYLLGLADSRVDAVVETAALDGECEVARAIGGDPIPAFGSTDCRCQSHLHYSPRRDHLLASIERAHEAAATTGGRKGAVESD